MILIIRTTNVGPLAFRTSHIICMAAEHICIYTSLESFLKEAGPRLYDFPTVLPKVPQGAP